MSSALRLHGEHKTVLAVQAKFNKALLHIATANFDLRLQRTAIVRKNQYDSTLDAPPDWKTQWPADQHALHVAELKSPDVFDVADAAEATEATEAAEPPSTSGDGVLSIHLGNGGISIGAEVIRETAPDTDGTFWDIDEDGATPRCVLRH